MSRVFFQMKNLWILISLFALIDGRILRTKFCRDCQGKLHTREELQSTKLPLLLDKNTTCFREQYKFIVIVKSSSFQRRNFTRRTWAREIIEHFNIPVLYAVGYTQNATINEQIRVEDRMYNDLLQFPILESYYNLTLKTISILLWYDRYCSNSSTYLFYVDDDILIHVDRFIVFMNEKNQSNAMEGWFETLGKIQRTGLGGISKEHFPIDIVPDYLWGAAVLYPSNVISHALIPTIFNTSLPIFFRDDVFINGFIAEEAKVKRQAMNDIVLYDRTENQLQKTMIVISFQTEEDRYRAWNCYRYEFDCYHNYHISLILTLMGLILLAMLGYHLWKRVRSSSFIRALKYELILWYNGMSHPWIRHMFSTIGNWREFRSMIPFRCPRFSRRTGIRVLPLVVICIIFYFIIEFVGNTQ